MNSIRYKAISEIKVFEMHTIWKGKCDNYERTSI